jgi:hypothetical protein
LGKRLANPDAVALVDGDSHDLAGPLEAKIGAPARCDYAGILLLDAIRRNWLYADGLDRQRSHSLWLCSAFRRFTERYDGACDCNCTDTYGDK